MGTADTVMMLGVLVIGGYVAIKVLPQLSFGQTPTTPPQQTDYYIVGDSADPARCKSEFNGSCNSECNDSGSAECITCTAVCSGGSSGGGKCGSNKTSSGRSCMVCVSEGGKWDSSRNCCSKGCSGCGNKCGGGSSSGGGGGGGTPSAIGPTKVGPGGRVTSPVTPASKKSDPCAGLTGATLTACQNAHYARRKTYQVLVRDHALNRIRRANLTRMYNSMNYDPYSII